MLVMYLTGVTLCAETVSTLIEICPPFPETVSETPDLESLRKRNLLVFYSAKVCLSNGCEMSGKPANQYLSVSDCPDCLPGTKVMF